MNPFEQRERAAENRFFRDEEARFRASAHRNRLLGLWAAAKLGKAAESAEAYAKTVVASDFEEIGDEDVFRKIRNDFVAAGLAGLEEEIRLKMDSLMTTAIDHVRGEL